MPKFASTDVMDAALNVVRNNATRMVAVNGQPLDYAAANGGKLAEAVMAQADFTFGAGVPDGRKVQVAAKSGAAVIGAGGTANHIALLDPVPPGRLLYVTTCPAQALAAGGTVSFASWDIEIGNPV